MKIRAGFVSNSSSSSFVINKSKLTEEQIYKILNYDSESKKYWSSVENYPFKDDCDTYYKLNDIGISDNGWTLDETDDSIEGWTVMNNFDFRSYMELIGIDIDDKTILEKYEVD